MSEAKQQNESLQLSSDVGSQAADKHTRPTCPFLLVSPVSVALMMANKLDRDLQR